VTAFLAAELRGARAELDALVARDERRAWTHVEPRLVRLARGVREPAPWDPAGTLPPTPRQHARLVHADGAAAGAAVLARFRDLEPRGPLYTSTMLAGALLFRLAADGRVDEARSYLAALREIPLDGLSLFRFLADMSLLREAPGEARAVLGMACALDPDDAELAARLRGLADAR
jgi:hypothetical protein